MIHLVGTNHKRTSVDGRERLASGQGPAAELVASARADLGARECVLLATCNRFEAYFLASPHLFDPTAARSLFGAGVAGGEVLAADSIYYHSGREAVAHLLTVASGLDSMVLGEHEILGQVKSALAGALERKQAGPTLTRLFQHAVRTGKRARRETAISRGIFSLGQCAARVAEGVLGDLEGKRVLMLGAGRMAKMTGKHLAAFGARPIAVFSRTPERARDLAAALGGQAIGGTELIGALQTADILIGCAAAPHHIIGRPQVEQALEGRQHRPLVVIDLGVPRNVDPAVRPLAGVNLFDLDDLEAVVAENAEAREAEIERVRAIVAEETAEFERWHARARAAAIVARLQAKAEEVRQECLRKVAGKPLGEGDASTLDYLTDLLVRKLLHRPLVALREAVGEEPGEADLDLTSAVARLFDLAESSQPEVLEQPADERATPTADDPATPTAGETSRRPAGKLRGAGGRS